MLISVSLCDGTYGRMIIFILHCIICILSSIAMKIKSTSTIQFISRCLISLHFNLTIVNFDFCYSYLECERVKGIYCHVLCCWWAIKQFPLPIICGFWFSIVELYVHKNESRDEQNIDRAKLWDKRRNTAKSQNSQSWKRVLEFKTICSTFFTLFHIISPPQLRLIWEVFNMINVFKISFHIYFAPSQKNFIHHHRRLPHRRVEKINIRGNIPQHHRQWEKCESVDCMYTFSKTEKRARGIKVEAIKIIKCFI